MEGPLSKWTNVMKGWQYRWFVLDDGSGLLSYYTSKEKMLRGSRRGCVRLKGAVVGIDDDDDSTFTITVDAKTFHFQAHHHEEREKWLRALEDTIIRHAAAQRKWNPNLPLPTMADFDRKLTESDAYLQLLIDQSNKLEQQCHGTEDPNNKALCQKILADLNQVLESIKHCIMLLQIAKSTAFPTSGVYHPCNAVPEHESHIRDVPVGHSMQTGIEIGKECSEELNINLTGIRQDTAGAQCLIPLRPVPDMSYSSSEEEDFFDADDFERGVSIGPRLFEDAVENLPSDGTAKASSQATVSDGSQALHKRLSYSASDRPISKSIEDDDQSNSTTALPHVSEGPLQTQIDNNTRQDIDPLIDYDSMYDEGDDELCSLEGHGSVIQHLISQVKIGMDLTKVVLPTFILERRSLLEMYADFFAHPDLFCSIVDYSDPRDRIVQVLKWYLSAFHAGRKSAVARKPYNPILGEIFKCYWDLEDAPEGGGIDNEAPVPWASSEQLAFIAEQVSHHPPVSAFYAEHKRKRISFCGHIWTKSKFLGLSVCVNNIGQGCVSLLDRDEEYIVNFPSGYGRSILTVPWVELGGTCQLTCTKTGYNATIEFLTKPFYGGKKHRICAEVTSPGEKKPFLVVEGEWNGQMNAKWSDGRTEPFVDTLIVPIVKKNVKSVIEQDRNESRFLWKEVTAGLKFNDINQATGAKFALEQKQRAEAKERKELDETWQTKLFSLEGENWVYDRALQKRSQS